MPVPSSRGRALCWAGGMQGVAAPPASPGVGWEAAPDPGLHPKACGHGAEGGDYFPLCSALLRPCPGFKGRGLPREVGTFLEGKGDPSL